jgi:hypothetical protein
MTGSVNQPRSLFHKLLFLIGISGFQTPLWQMSFWTEPLITITDFHAWRFIKNDPMISRHLTHFV